jgi:hypothetical protein
MVMGALFEIALASSPGIENERENSVTFHPYRGLVGPVSWEPADIDGPDDLCINTCQSFCPEGAWFTQPRATPWGSENLSR